MGIALGALLGFIAGAIAVGLVALYFKRKTKSYDTYSPDGGPRRSVEYFASPPQNLVPSHTRPVPIQPNIYKLKRETDEEEPEEDDGEERVRVTEPYDHRAVQMGVISEEEEQGAQITELPQAKDGESPATKRKKLTRGLSLPSNIVSSDLIHYNQDILTRDAQQCLLETSMFYDTASKELHVTVIQVIGIPTPDESFLRPPNCSVKMRILPEMLAWQWTRKISRTVSPVFNETFIIPGFVHNKLRECTVHFVVLDFDHVQDNVYVIGEVFMPLSELRANRLEKICKRVNPLSI